MQFRTTVVYRWWFWLVVVPLVLLAITVFTIRVTGLMALRQEAAAALAAGDPGSGAELAAWAPAVDAARQQRLAAWLRTVQSPPWGMPYDDARQHLAQVLGFAPPPWQKLPPVQCGLYVAELRGHLRSCAALLDEGPLTWSWLGTVAADPAGAGSTMPRMWAQVEARGGSRP